MKDGAAARRSPAPRITSSAPATISRTRWLGMSSPMSEKPAPKSVKTMEKPSTNPRVLKHPPAALLHLLHADARDERQVGRAGAAGCRGSGSWRRPRPGPPGTPSGRVQPEGSSYRRDRPRSRSDLAKSTAAHDTLHHIPSGVDDEHGRHVADLVRVDGHGALVEQDGKEYWSCMKRPRMPAFTRCRRHRQDRRFVRCFSIEPIEVGHLRPARRSGVAHIDHDERLAPVLLESSPVLPSRVAPENAGAVLVRQPW